MYLIVSSSSKCLTLADIIIDRTDVITMRMINPKAIPTILCLSEWRNISAPLDSARRRSRHRKDRSWKPAGAAYRRTSHHGRLRFSPRAASYQAPGFEQQSSRTMSEIHQSVGEQAPFDR